MEKRYVVTFMKNKYLKFFIKFSNKFFRFGINTLAIERLKKKFNNLESIIIILFKWNN